jgi:hypothetical protein
MAVAGPVRSDLPELATKLDLRSARRADPSPVGGTMLSGDPARSALGDLEAPLQVRRCIAAACRAQKFPRATSFSISMSRSRSATICFSRRFSSRSRRSSFTSSALIPP